MSTEAAFLHSIEADLADPAQLLIFADWLEEQGEERPDILRPWSMPVCSSLLISSEHPLVVVLAKKTVLPVRRSTEIAPPRHPRSPGVSGCGPRKLPATTSKTISGSRIGSPFSSP
jgi:uncharacterized protein (TIGR02996 family)